MMEGCSSLKSSIDKIGLIKSEENFLRLMTVLTPEHILIRIISYK